MGLMTIMLVAISGLYLVSCGGDLPTVDVYPSKPSGVAAIVDGSSIYITWQPVSGANSYKIYRSSSADGSYKLNGGASSASYRDNSPMSGYNYYKVSAVNNLGEGLQSSYASCNFTNEGSGSNTVPPTPTQLVCPQLLMVLQLLFPGNP